MIPSIEVARSKKENFLYQGKYVLDILFDAGLLGCKYVNARWRLMQSCYQIGRGLG